MNGITVFLFILVVEKSLATGATHRDPSACQRIIKFMLINACGATKREFRPWSFYKVMTNEEIEKRYHDMVQAKMIKGIERTHVKKVDMDTNHIDDTEDNEIYKNPYYHRLRRSVIGVGLGGHMKTYAEAIEHERRGSFHFISHLPSERADTDGMSPPPGDLKAKCCGGPILCTMDDFRGFCE